MATNYLPLVVTDNLDFALRNFFVELLGLLLRTIGNTQCDFQQPTNGVVFVGLRVFTVTSELCSQSRNRMLIGNIVIELISS